MMDHEHSGCLYWLITRTSESAEANLVLEPIQWSSSVDVKLPNKKLKQCVKWEANELPQLPVLVNKKGLKAHTFLKVFWNEKKTHNMPKSLLVANEVPPAEPPPLVHCVFLAGRSTAV